METPKEAQASPSQQLNRKFLGQLRWLSFAEGLSTLVLFGIAMPLKYYGGMPLPVRIAGSLHGALFVGLVLMLMVAISKIPISKSMAACGMLAAVVPFGPFIFDRWFVRKIRA